MSMRPRMVGALLGALAAFGVAGVGFAGAQETPTTEPPAAEAPSSTPAPETTEPESTAPGRDNCHHGDDDGDTGDAPAAADNTSL